MRTREQRGRDNKARNHKKDINPEITARQPSVINVIKNHGQNGQGSQTINLRPIADPNRPTGALCHRSLQESLSSHLYSHSIVPGGLLVMSSTTRFTPFTSFTIRFEICSNRS